MSDSDFMTKVERTGGTTCPCCGQFAKIYKRSLSSAIAYGLIRLHRMKVNQENMMLESNTNVDNAGFFHVAQIMSGYGATLGGDFAKAEMWGLIEAMPNNDESKRTSGMWKITDKGSSFVHDLIKVQSHVFVYNGEKQGFSEKKISIKDALHTRFDYAELMKA